MRIIACLGWAVLAAVFMIPLTLDAQRKPCRKTKLPPELKEISGLVFLGSRDSGACWMHNDNGNAPILFKKNVLKNRLQKGVAAKIQLPTQNIDWEDLAADPAGNLYLGDFGNNGNARRDLRIFIFNPKTGTLDSILFDYPDQRHFPPGSQKLWNFDCEAMVFSHDSLHLFSKNRFVGNFYCKHYVLPARPGRFTATLRDSIRLPGHVVTGASISGDGRTLALVSYFFEKKWGFWPKTRASVWFFDGFEGSRFFRGKVSRQRVSRILISRQVESIAWFSGNYWLIANEGIAHQKPTIRRFKRRVR